MLKVILKFLLAIGLCYWLFKSGKLDFTLITQSFHLGYLWILGLILLSCRFFIGALRFKILLDTKVEAPISYLKIFSFDAIGNLFSVILPGTAAGDVIRFFYYKNLSARLTSGNIIAFISIDRLWGVFGLLALGLLLSLIQYNHLRELNSQLISLTIINFLGFLFLLLLIWLLFFDSAISKRMRLLLADFLIRWPKAQNTLNDVLSVKVDLKISLQCLFLSMTGHTFMIVGFWVLILPFIPSTTPFLNLSSIIPIGMIGTAMPIAPSGLGVGHVLFENLFKFIQIDNGASLFNLYFVANVAFCLLGFIPYLIVKRS